jgi:hypothetical protein
MGRGSSGESARSRAQSIALQVDGLGVVQCMCTVTLGSFDVLVCVTSSSTLVVVDLRRGQPWTSKVEVSELCCLSFFARL